MNPLKHLKAAGVPEHLWVDAMDSLDEAYDRSRGLTLAKWRVRLFKAGKIAELIPWEAERLIDVRPDLADWDIAPVVNITAHGDNAPWVMTPDGGRPAPGRWMNADPTSEDYERAVRSNYWCKGEHPRSKESRKAWYRRNAGEYRAWRLGQPVDPANVQRWTQGDTTVIRAGNAWQIVAKEKWLGIIPVKVRVGHEIDNVVSPDGTQNWYPIAGHELRAPVSWSVIPGVK